MHWKLGEMHRINRLIRAAVDDRAISSLSDFWESIFVNYKLINPTMKNIKIDAY